MCLMDTKDLDRTLKPCLLTSRLRRPRRTCIPRKQNYRMPPQWASIRYMEIVLDNSILPRVVIESSRSLSMTAAGMSSWSISLISAFWTSVIGQGKRTGLHYLGEGRHLYGPSDDMRLITSPPSKNRRASWRVSKTKLF